MKLDGKVAFITGAGRGIGRAIALCFAEAGADLILTDINVTNLSNVENLVQEKYGNRCLVSKMNVKSEEDIKKVVEESIQKFGKIDILVNNAGICQAGSFEEVPWEDWQEIIEVNLGGTVKCSKAVVPHMKKQKYGKIINFSSLSAEVGGIAVAPSYAASKAAISCFTKSLAKYCAPFNINVNAVAPGIIMTDMTAELPYNDKTIPLERKGMPEEVADVVLFLASERSRYITGTTIDVNGGIYMK
jgi:3-oxoacyl-[acyl-carrier protein] reductase